MAVSIVLGLNGAPTPGATCSQPRVPALRALQLGQLHPAQRSSQQLCVSVRVLDLTQTKNHIQPYTIILGTIVLDIGLRRTIFDLYLLPCMHISLCGHRAATTAVAYCPSHRKGQCILRTSRAGGSGSHRPFSDAQLLSQRPCPVSASESVPLRCSSLRPRLSAGRFRRFGSRSAALCYGTPGRYASPFATVTALESVNRVVC